MRLFEVLSPGGGIGSLQISPRHLIAVVAMSVVLCGPAGAQTPPSGEAYWTPRFSVLTHHYDNHRTGWNPLERILNAGNVNAKSFGLLYTVPVDDQVDAQPLVVGLSAGNEDDDQIAGLKERDRRVRDVVYIATESDTVFAIDAETGAVLRSRNLATPVLRSALPGGCNAGGANLGINSTPVIDLPSETMYVITYGMENGQPVFRLHALDLRSLHDKLPPVLVTASHSLTNGTTYNFNPAVTRQRAALLEANGNIYAAFTSFCDFEGNVTRGWVLGWQAASLTPLAANELTDKLYDIPGHFYLSTIWMSGAGLAADGFGNLFFVTGNSAVGTYDGVNNIQESVVKMAPDLSRVLDLFTPSGALGVDILDGGDNDFGAGGVLLLPPQPGPIPYLAVAAGKDGQMYLLNRANLGGYNPNGANNVVGTFTIGGCWCAQSYFFGPDGAGHLVTSGGRNLILWKVQTSPEVTLVKEGASPDLQTGQDPGFFTTVSSNGIQAGSYIVWAVMRPVNTNPASVELYAVDQSGLLFAGVAGTWPNVNGNANIVPVVANGKVFVASYKQLAIFGQTSGRPAAAVMSAPNDAKALPLASKEHQVTGIVSAISSSLITLQTRTSRFVVVESAAAVRANLSVIPVPGRALLVRGSFAAHDFIRARTILRAKDSPAGWEPDH